MYSPKVIANLVSQVEASTGIRFKEYSPGQTQAWAGHLGKLVVWENREKWHWQRDLTEEEKMFILNEQLLCKINFPYWATRYAYIRHEKGGNVLMNFRESQELMMGHISDMQEQGLPIKIINLKARQVYSSTLSELILTHKVTTTSGVTSLLAADTPDQSEFLFNMMQRVFEHLPVYLQPHRKYEVKGAQMFFDIMDSNVLVNSGNKLGGGLGQGKAIHSGHLSELATWNDPDMVTADLMPAIISAQGPNTFFILESTAKGKVSRWRDWWLSAKREEFFGFRPVMIPWYVLKEKYAEEPSVAWRASERVLNVARSLKLTKGVDLSKKQLYWWEKMYENYKSQNKLNEFFAEYASDDEEAFQLTGKSVFPIEVIQDLRRKAMSKPFCPYELQERSLN